MTPPSSSQHQACTAPCRRRARDVVGEQRAARQLARAGAARLDLAHVRDVEDAARAHGRPGAPRGCPRTARASPSPRRHPIRAPAPAWRSCREVCAGGPPSGSGALPREVRPARRTCGPPLTSGSRGSPARRRGSRSPCARTSRGRSTGGRARPARGARAAAGSRSRSRRPKRGSRACGGGRRPPRAVEAGGDDGDADRRRPAASSMTAPKIMLQSSCGGLADDPGGLVDLEQAEVACRR